MKRLFLSFLSIALIASAAIAQDGKKLFKTGQKAINKYISDPVANADGLADGLKSLEEAFGDAEFAGNAKNLIKKGELLNSIADAEMKLVLLDPEAKISNPDVGMKAMEAFKAAMADEKQQKNALKGLASVQGILNNIAINYFRGDDYANAYKNYAATLELHDMLTTNGKESILTDETINDQKFYTAATGYLSDNGAAVMPILEDLYKVGYQDALVYEALYSTKKDSDPEGALAALEAGRKALPDDSQLLFTEINHYLTAGNLDVLITKLEMAKEKEPENTSVVVTMGSVYDQLNQKEREAGNIEKADEYFGKAKQAYQDVLAIDATNFDAQYSLGALYYNKAASMTAKINELSNDFTPAGTKKYNDLKAEMDGYFQEALPFFEKAESMNPEDANTLVALKEIAARNNDFEKAEAYKKRIEALQN